MLNNFLIKVPSLLSSHSLWILSHIFPLYFFPWLNLVHDANSSQLTSPCWHWFLQYVHFQSFPPYRWVTRIIEEAGWSAKSFWQTQCWSKNREPYTRSWCIMGLRIVGQRGIPGWDRPFKWFFPICTSAPVAWFWSLFLRCWSWDCLLISNIISNEKWYLKIIVDSIVNERTQKCFKCIFL